MEAGSQAPCPASPRVPSQDAPARRGRSPACASNTGLGRSRGTSTRLWGGAAGTSASCPAAPVAEDGQGRRSRQVSEHDGAVTDGRHGGWCWPSPGRLWTREANCRRASLRPGSLRCPAPRGRGLRLTRTVVLGAAARGRVPRSRGCLQRCPRVGALAFTRSLLHSFPPSLHLLSMLTRRRLGVRGQRDAQRRALPRWGSQNK